MDREFLSQSLMRNLVNLEKDLKISVKEVELPHLLWIKKARKDF